MSPFNTQIKFNYAIKEDNYGLNSSRENVRNSMDLFNSQSYLKNESVRSTIFNDKSKFASTAVTLGSNFTQSARQSFVNISLQIPREKPEWEKGEKFNYRKQPNVIHCPDVYPNYRYDSNFLKPKTDLKISVF